MLKELNEKQEQLMYKIRQDWIDKFFRNSGKLINKKKAAQGIEFLYSLIDLPKPDIYYISSPLGMHYMGNIFTTLDNNKDKLNQVNDQISDQVSDQISRQVNNQVYNQVYNQVCNQVCNQVRSQVYNQVSDQVCNQVCNQVCSQVYNQVSDQVCNQVCSQVYNQVSDQVCNQVRSQVYNQVSDQVRNQTKDQKLKYFSNSWGEDISNYGWTSFYTFFKEINILKNVKFNKYLDLLNANIFTSIYFNGLVILCEFPETIKFMETDKIRLHCEDGPSLKWRDGYELYFLYGIHFKEEMYKRIISQEMSFKEVLSIKNIEQRYAALRFIDSEKLIKESNAKLIHKSDKGNELWESEIDSIHTNFLRYSCPSTDRIYIKYIPPNKFNNADDAQAWSGGIDVREYLKMKIEA